MTDQLRSVKLVKASQLTVRECDEGIIVFDATNGKTSLLNYQGALVLNTLHPSEGVSEAVVRTKLGMDEESDEREFEALIASLEKSGLVIRC